MVCMYVHLRWQVGVRGVRPRREGPGHGGDEWAGHARDKPEDDAHSTVGRMGALVLSRRERQSK